MKRVMLIFPLLIMNAYAGNCYRMSNEELREIESYWASVKVHSGVRCDNDVFINVSVRSKYGCISEIGNTRDFILNGRHDRVVYDEFGMPIKNIDNMSKNASCEKLYLDFKSKTCPSGCISEGNVCATGCR